MAYHARKAYPMNVNKEILQFLRELRQHNDRAWFQAQKARYDHLREAFMEEVQQLIEHIAQFEPALIGLQAPDCLYRIYRDLRWSTDRTPYKTHFAAYMAPGGRRSEYGGYYIHLEPDNCLLAGGVWCPPVPILKKIRQDIAVNGEELGEILASKPFHEAFGTFYGEKLTRVPAGFLSDAPYAEWLKYKDYSVMSRKDESFFTSSDWMQKTLADFRLLQPLNRFLNASVDEYYGK